MKQRKWLLQGGQSRSQHDWVHGFPEPVKSFITFLILSQISRGKVQKPLIFFCTKLCHSFSSVCCSFPDNLDQLKNKLKILSDWVHTSVGRSYLKNCSEPRRNFYTVLCKKYEGFFCTLPHEIRLSTRGIWKVLSMVLYLSNRFTNLIMFGIILKSYLSSMLWHKFHEDIIMQIRKILL